MVVPKETHKDKIGFQPRRVEISLCRREEKKKVAFVYVYYAVDLRF